MPSYAVIWREPSGQTFAGKAELSPRALKLEGGRGGRVTSRSIRFEHLAEARVARGSRDRLDGRPTLVLRLRDGRTVSVAAFNGVGTIRELADALAAALARGAMVAA